MPVCKSAFLSILTSICLCQGVARAEHAVYTDTDVAEETPTPTVTNQCWQFTWDGAYDVAEDLSPSCDDYFPNDVCFPPIIPTNGSNTMSGPNLGELEAACSNTTTG